MMEAPAKTSARQFRAGGAGSGGRVGQSSATSTGGQNASDAGGPLASASAFGAWLLGAAFGGGDEAAKRNSGRSQMSEDADWEVVQDGAHVGGDDDVRSEGSLGHVVRSAGQWAQWSYHGASIGVEKAVDGVKGMWHFKRLRAERQEALSLASRQQWQLMDIEHQRRRERQAAVEAEEKRARELRDQVRRRSPGPRAAPGPACSAAGSAPVGPAGSCAQRRALSRARGVSPGGDGAAGAGGGGERADAVEGAGGRASGGARRARAAGRRGAPPPPRAEGRGGPSETCQFGQ